VTRRCALGLVCLLVALGSGGTVGAQGPRHLWTQPGPWGDPSPRAAANGIEFWKPHPMWAVAYGKTGDSFVRFSKVRWHGWGTARVVATASLEDCVVVGLVCGEAVPVQLVLSRPRPISCGNGQAGGTLVYTRYELIGFRRLAGVQRATRAC
jgi:hypothetical protein